MPTRQSPYQPQSRRLSCSFSFLGFLQPDTSRPVAACRALAVSVSCASHGRGIDRPFAGGAGARTPGKPANFARRKANAEAIISRTCRDNVNASLTEKQTLGQGAFFGSQPIQR